MAQARLPDKIARPDKHTPVNPNEEVQEAGIRSVSSWTYSAGPAGTLGSGYRASSIAYDRQGLPLEQVSYDENGIVLKSIANTYDDEMRLVESVLEEHTGQANSQ